MSKLEEVARAGIASIDPQDAWVREYGLEDVVIDGNVNMIEFIRAALSALREPSIAMWEAFDDEMEFEAFSASWNSAIDKAMER